MIKLILTPAFIIFFVEGCLSQDSPVALIKRQIIVYDSLISEIASIKSYRTHKIVGGSAFFGRYSGEIYTKPDIDGICKLKILTGFSNKESLLYNFDSTLLRIDLNENYYYLIDNSYYTKDGNKVTYSDILKELLEYQKIFKEVTKLNY